MTELDIYFVAFWAAGVLILLSVFSLLWSIWSGKRKLRPVKATSQPILWNTAFIGPERSTQMNARQQT